MFENISWIYFSIAATIVFGVMTAFYKLPISKSVSKLTSLFWVAVIQSALAIIFFHKNIKFDIGIIIFAALWGISWLILTYLQMRSLHKLETNTVFPITTTSALVLSVIAGIFLFKDNISIIQSLGIILVILVVYLFSYKKGKINFAKETLLIVTTIIFFSAFNKIIQKYGANLGDLQSFQAFQYLFGLLAIIIILLFNTKKVKDFKDGAIPGLIIGTLSFVGGYIFLIGLSKGPFPLVTAIHSLYIIITAIFGYIIFKEKLTLKKIGLIVLAIVAVILIRIG